MSPRLVRSSDSSLVTKLRSPSPLWLRLACDDGFDVLITPDRSLPHQQNLGHFDIAVVVLAAGLNRMATYEPLAERLRDAVVSAPRGEALVFTA